MKKMLTHNLGLKLGSLVLAFVLWFLIVQIDNPRESKSFNNIPVQLRNTNLLAQENKVYQVLDNTDVVGRVTVVAPRSIVEQLRASDITAYADMSKLTELNTIEIYYDVAGVDSIDGSHDFVQLNVEEKATRWLRVICSCAGEPAEGYTVTETKLQQTQIEVTGPKSVVDTISYAKVEMNVSGAVSDLSANAPVKLYDKEDHVISEETLTKNVNYIYTTVEILATKTVPVEAKITGEPEEGYMMTGEVTIEPAEVTLAAKQFSLAGMTRVYLTGDALDITGATEDKTITMNMRGVLADGVKFADSAYRGDVKITVGVKKVVDKKMDIPTYRIALTNIPAGYEAVLAEEDTKISVRMKGLEQLINELSGSSISGKVDVTKWMRSVDASELGSGTFSMPVELKVPEGVEVLEDASIHVMISKQEQEE